MKLSSMFERCFSSTPDQSPLSILFLPNFFFFYTSLLFFSVILCLLALVFPSPLRPSHPSVLPHVPFLSFAQQCFLPQSPLMFKDQMQQDVIMVLKFPSNSPVTHVAANTLPHLTIPAVVTVTCSRLFAVNRWHNTVGEWSSTRMTCDMFKDIRKEKTGQCHMGTPTTAAAL